MFLEVCGKKIWYEVYGGGHDATLLYLHGGPGASCLDFVNQAKALGGKVKVVLLDQLGVLRSQAIAGEEHYSMGCQVELLEELRKLLGIGTWSVLGHSYGGMLAVLYAYTHPKSIDKVILECPSLWFEESARATARYLDGHIRSLGDGEAAALCEKVQGADYQDPAEIVWDLSNLLGYVTDPELQFYLHGISVEEYWGCMDTTGITDDMWAKGEQHLRKLLEPPPGPDRVRMTDNLLPLVPEVAAPMLLINGRYDPVCTEYQTRYIMDHGRQVTRAVFGNSGHYPRLEEAEHYTDTVLRFLGCL